MWDTDTIDLVDLAFGREKVAKSRMAATQDAAAKAPGLFQRVKKVLIPGDATQRMEQKLLQQAPAVEAKARAAAEQTAKEHRDWAEKRIGVPTATAQPEALPGTKIVSRMPGQQPATPQPVVPQPRRPAPPQRVSTEALSGLESADRRRAQQASPANQESTAALSHIRQQANLPSAPSPVASAPKQENIALPPGLVSSTPHPAAAQPAAAQPAAAQPAAAQPAAAQPAAQPQKGSLGRWALPGAAVALGGYSLYRGGNDANEQQARMQDLDQARRQNMAAPYPSMAVYGSYEERSKKASEQRLEKFALMKLSAPPPSPMRTPPGAIFPNVGNSMINQLGMSAADYLVRTPLEAARKTLRKKIYEEPKRRSVFNYVMENDPELREHHEKNPQMIGDAYHTMKEYAPSLLLDANAVKSFLRQSIITGGNIDYVTINMLSQIEKQVQQAKGRIGTSNT